MAMGEGGGDDTRTPSPSKPWACITSGKYWNIPLSQLGQHGKVPDYLGSYK